MFVRTLDEMRAAGQEKVMVGGRARVVRALTAVDGLGFSFSDVSVAAGSETTLWYKNHWEMNYIVSGRGEVEDLTSGESWPLAAGTLYTVGPKDRHKITAAEDMRAICVFNPPITGGETHDEDGAYPPTGPIPEGQERMFVKSVGEMRAAGREMVVADGSARTVRMLLKEDRVGVTMC